MKKGRIQQLFDRKKNGILSVYCTAGFPYLEATTEILESLQRHGADMIEIGIPFSDPLADGPVIQHSSSVAIRNGMTLPVLFGQLKGIREKLGDTIPLILMGYLNPVLQYGFEKFCGDAAEAGIDGLILPDLPVFEFESRYRPVIQQHGLDFIFLVTPETTPERVKLLDHCSSGFLYAVSSSSTTGGGLDTKGLAAYLQRLDSYHLKNPVLVGFGIRDRESFLAACQFSAGAVIGSAYIKALEHSRDVNATTNSFCSSILR